MSHRTPNDSKDEENDTKFLTLEDKKPSVLLSGTISPKSISTRQLSDNLQTTREGLINLMRKHGEGNDLGNGNIRTTRGSGSETGDDDENDSFQNFGMPFSSKQSEEGENIRSGGVTTSKEFDNVDQNKNSGLSSQDFRNYGLGSKDIQVSHKNAKFVWQISKIYFYYSEENMD